MRRYIQIALSSAVFTILLTFAANAQVATGGNYTLDQSVIASGGGQNATGGTFSLDGAIGQAVAGTTSTNSPFSISGGFFTNQTFAPTAAGVTISGRVRMENGNGIRNVLITLITMDGTTRSTLSGLSGKYSFTDVAAGQTVILTATGKRFTFSQPIQVLNLTEEASGIDFIGIQQGLSVD